MSEMMLLAGAAAAIAAVLAYIGIWSPRKLWVKLVALGSVTLFLPVAYLSLSELLGHPKPVDIAWAERSLPEAQVIASHMVEDRAIYLWLGFEGETEPMAYTLPWTQQAAEELQRAEQEAKANGTGVMMNMPFERTEDDLERKFYAAPQPALPPKQPPSGDPVVLQQQGATAPPGGRRQGN